MNESLLDRGLSFIGFLWRVRRAVCQFEHPCIHLLALGSACSADGNIPFGVDLLAFSHAGVLILPIPLLESSHGLFLNPSLLSSDGFGSPGWLFA